MRENVENLPQVNHINEIKGVYVPFWLFDASVTANITYRGEKTRHWSDSEYEYIEHNYYNIYRAGSVAFDNGFNRFSIILFLTLLSYLRQTLARPRGARLRVPVHSILPQHHAHTAPPSPASYRLRRRVRESALADAGYL